MLEITHSYSKLNKRVSLLHNYYASQINTDTYIVLFLLDFIDTWNNPDSTLNSYRKIDKIVKDTVIQNIKWGLWKLVVKFFQENENINEISLYEILNLTFGDYDLQVLMKYEKQTLIRKDIL